MDDSESGHGLLGKLPQAALMAAFVGTSLLSSGPAQSQMALLQKLHQGHLGMLERPGEIDPYVTHI